MNNTNDTIVIKRIKAAHGHAHHGGAWKVAYADFVTAMMAFFLLMWLLNATTESQRKGLADYFDPRIPISKVSGGGSDMFMGSSMFAKEQLAQNGTGGTASEAIGNDETRTKFNEDKPQDAPDTAAHNIDLTRQPGQLRDREQQGELRRQNGGNSALEGPATAYDQPANTADEQEAYDQPSDITDEQKARAEQRAEGQQLAREITERVRARADFQGLDQHLIFRVTEEGLRIEVVARDGKPMFRSGATEATPRMRSLVQVIAEVVRDVDNKVALTGHTDSSPFVGRSGYSNWELSAERANTARRILQQYGVGADRISRVEGLADTVPLIEGASIDPRNRRIGIIIMRGDR